MQLAKAYTPPKMAKLCTMQNTKVSQHASTMMAGTGWAQQVHDLMQRCRAGGSARCLNHAEDFCETFSIG